MTYEMSNIVYFVKGHDELSECETDARALLERFRISDYGTLIAKRVNIIEGYATHISPEPECEIESISAKNGKDGDVFVLHASPDCLEIEINERKLNVFFRPEI